ncbi:MAG: TetR/AcrR family transcriptional regulator [Actinomycetota bacterium]|nr:TetR/AcrR family transcriptional regulator [Actinomycetota bacterium]
MLDKTSGPESGSSTASAPSASLCRIELPVLGVGVVRERADAARNRLRVLAAAERLFANRGVAGVTMDDVAAAAGVGKGTLYRRFVDKGGLAVALLDERERELQRHVLTGPPPLGPGTEPALRLAAFVAGYLTFLDRQLDLVLLSETSTPGARLLTGAHGFWRQHCHYLLSQAGAPQPDLRAELLLAGLAADQVRHWLRVQHRNLDDLADGLSSAAVALARPTDTSKTRAARSRHSKSDQ